MTSLSLTLVNSTAIFFGHRIIAICDERLTGEEICDPF